MGNKINTFRHNSEYEIIVFDEFSENSNEFSENEFKNITTGSLIKNLFDRTKQSIINKLRSKYDVVDDHQNVSEILMFRL